MSSSNTSTGKSSPVQGEHQPVVSIDTKKKELVGEFYNAGREWRPAGNPVEVKVHDFPDKKLGKAIPYGVDHLASNEGWVSVGIDHDTAEFAAASICRWWREMGAQRFPRAKKLMITADGGGSNSSRNRLWKVALQGLAERVEPAIVRLSFSSRHQQVEQDRASPVQLYHEELARASTRHLQDGREPHRQHHHDCRPEGAGGDRYDLLRNGYQGERRNNWRK